MVASLTTNVRVVGSSPLSAKPATYREKGGQLSL